MLVDVDYQPHLAHVDYLEEGVGRLDRLTERIEASETRTGLAISGVEHSVRQALARIETAEREQHTAAARLEGLLAETQAEVSYHGERMRRIEADPIGPRSAEALRLIEARLARGEPEQVVEAVLERLGDRLAMAEARTAAALHDLKGSLESGDAEAISAKTQTLIQASMKLGEAMYKSQQGDAEGASASDANAASDDVVDAEFEEVDGDGKKSA